MIPREVLEMAKKGGWTDSHLDYYDTHADIALDPSFWQSLGKALGYDQDGDGTVMVWKGTWVRQSFDAERQIVLGDDWQNMAHDFYDLILTGGDTEAFWQQLLTNNQHHE